MPVVSKGAERPFSFSMLIICSKVGQQQTTRLLIIARGTDHTRLSKHHVTSVVQRFHLCSLIFRLPAVEQLLPSNAQ